MALRGWTRLPRRVLIDRSAILMQYRAIRRTSQFVGSLSFSSFVGVLWEKHHIDIICLDVPLVIEKGQLTWLITFHNTDLMYIFYPLVAWLSHGHGDQGLQAEFTLIGC
jgi:hypothetical protein